METLIGDMTPYKDNAYIGRQLHRAQQLHEELSTKLFATAEKTAATTTETVPKVRAVSAAPPPYKIKPPSFSGTREFHAFKERFTAIMDVHKEYYSDSDKLCILAEAMENAEAKKIVLDCHASGYAAAMVELQSNYGKKSVIFPQLVDELVKRDKYDYSRESMKMIIDRTQRVLGEMEKLKARY